MNDSYFPTIFMLVLETAATFSLVSFAWCMLIPVYFFLKR